MTGNGMLPLMQCIRWRSTLKCLEKASAIIHVVASDAHSPRRRTPTLSHARDLIAEHCGAEPAEFLFHENPSRILQDMDLFIHSMTKRKKHFSIFSAFCSPPQHLGSDIMGPLIT